MKVLIGVYSVLVICLVTVTSSFGVITCDYNGDGKTGLEEVIMNLRVVSGMEVETNFDLVHCDGNPFGGIVYDICGVCGGDGSTCKGCDGIPGSNTYLDACGVCGGDNSTCTLPDGVVYHPENGHFYRGIEGSFTWANAQTYCQNYGGYLATLTTQAEDQFVYNDIVSVLGGNHWLGASDLDSEGTWKWVTGEPWSYEQWGNGEPNDDSGQDNLNMIFDGTWDDAGMPGYPEEYLNAVCEWDSFEEVLYDTGFIIPTATIAIDGDKADWSGVAPVLVDGEGDENPAADFVGTDIKSFSLAKDDTFLYMLIEVHDGPPNTDVFTVYQFQTNLSQTGHDSPGDINAGAYTDPDTELWMVRVNQRTSGDDIHLATYPPNYLAIGSDFVEWKVPLSILGDLNGRYMRAYTHVLGIPAEVSEDEIIKRYITDYTETDCNGVEEGTAYLDNCGSCVGGDTGESPCNQDCYGDWGGTAYLDDCDTCVGGNTGESPCGLDCNGDANGSAFLDNCNNCVGGNTGEVACIQDCKGDWGGTAIVDACGVCDGDGSSCSGGLTAGAWIGVSSQGLPYSFTVVDDNTLSNFVYRMGYDCGGQTIITETTVGGTISLTNGSFTVNNSINICNPTQPWLTKPVVITGTFSGKSALSGTFSYNTTQTGTWTAGPAQ